ncbi:MAG: hypothetical protein EXR58_07570 [Chloroflexi bacterium]|nr:hypothetical protein [Chloroflexota bacterium]
MFADFRDFYVNESRYPPAPDRSFFPDGALNFMRKRAYYDRLSQDRHFLMELSSLFSAVDGLAPAGISERAWLLRFILPLDPPDHGNSADRRHLSSSEFIYFRPAFALIETFSQKWKLPASAARDLIMSYGYFEQFPEPHLFPDFLEWDDPAVDRTIRLQLPGGGLLSYPADTVSRDWLAQELDRLFADLRQQAVEQAERIETQLRDAGFSRRSRSFEPDALKSGAEQLYLHVCVGINFAEIGRRVQKHRQTVWDQVRDWADDLGIALA